MQIQNLRLSQNQSQQVPRTKLVPHFGKEEKDLKTPVKNVSLRANNNRDYLQVESQALVEEGGNKLKNLLLSKQESEKRVPEQNSVIDLDQIQKPLNPYYNANFVHEKQ